MQQEKVYETTITFRITEDAKEFIQLAAEREKLTMSQFIRNLVFYYYQGRLK